MMYLQRRCVFQWISGYPNRALRFASARFIVTAIIAFVQEIVIHLISRLQWVVITHKASHHNYGSKLHMVVKN